MPYGGPNYFDLEADSAIYEIHIDNDGDAREDVTFRFNFADAIADLKVPAGGEQVSVPLKNIGGIGPGAGDTGAVNVRQTYKIDVIRGNRRSGPSAADHDDLRRDALPQARRLHRHEVDRRTTRRTHATTSTTSSYPDCGTRPRVRRSA